MPSSNKTPSPEKLSRLQKELEEAEIEALAELLLDIYEDKQREKAKRNVSEHSCSNPVGSSK